MLFHRFTALPMAALLILSLQAAPARAADPIAVAAKDLMKKHGDSVVSVSGTMKLIMSMQGLNMPAQESKFESAGTIVDASGLTVVSNSTIDFGDALNAALAGGGGDAAGQIKTKLEFSALKMRLADGTEIPARIVLTDKELDMAFIMPDADSEEGKKAAGKYPALKMDGAAVTVETLDEVIAIGRLPKSLGRQPSVQLARISAVVTKPRTFYAAASLSGSGTPVFTLDGKLLGIQLMRVDSDHSGAPGGGLLSAGPDLGFPIIVPAADVAETARQALTKK